MPTRSGTRRLYKHAYAQVFEQPWLLIPEKLAQITELLELRRNGQEYSDDQIRERCGIVVARGWDDDEEDEPPYAMQDGVAILGINGTLFPRAGSFERMSGATSTTQMHADFRAAMNDPNVRGILLQVDSPGGAAVAVPEFADTIRAARGVKPVYAVATGMAASGAYWLASAAERFYVSTSASAGSIGVYMAHTDMSKAEERRGVKTTLISAGRHKVDGNPYEPLTAQGRETIEERIGAIYTQFIDAVALNRGVSAQTMIDGPGQGKVYLADHAVRVGLADGVQTLEQTLAELQTRIRRPVAATHAAPPSYVYPAAAAIVAPLSSPLPGGSPVNAQLKSALHARGLIKADASDEHAQIALGSFFAARGQSQPATDADTMAALFAAVPQASGVMGIASPLAHAAPVAPAAGQGEQALSATERQRLVTEATAAEQSRIDQLSARATLIGVAAADLQTAIKSGWSLETACSKWTENLSSDRAPLARRNDDIRGTGSEFDTIHAAASDVLIERIGASVKGTLNLAGKDGKPHVPHPAAADMRYMTFFDIAHAAVKAAGINTSRLDREDIAKQFLMLAPRDALNLNNVSFGSPQANGPSYNTPSMFPNLLAGLAHKVMEGFIPPANTTYEIWAKQLASVPDFNPRAINRHGMAGELPRLIDNDKFSQATFAEEANWIATEEFGDKFGLTPRMITQDDLSVFTDFLPAQITRLKRTLNRLCIEILTGNPLLPDGTALLATARTNLIQQNDISFSIANVNQAKVAVKRFTSVGGGEDLGLPLSVILVPPELETAATQFFLPFNMVPATNAEVNVFRGKYQVVEDAMLSNTADWYGFVDKMMAAAVVYMHQQGYENGKKETWYDPDFRTQWFSIEARMGAAANNWRGVIALQDNND